MSVRPLPAAEAVLRLGDFDAVIDARSEGEFAEDHLPGALNWPSSENARFTGRHVVVLIDNDAKGRKRREIVRELAPVARSVRDRCFL